ncbi:MAG: hypothetical protein J0H55_07180 [Chitinophagaceae bacterium]|nr:hypothetical protein [Chitinophagaceae bacterium]
MKKPITLFFLMACFSVIYAQSQSLANRYSNGKTSPKADLSKVNFNGQWRGSFDETTPNVFGLVSQVRTTYVLELEVKGSKVGGYSYTYFNDPGEKRYYTICRINGYLDRKLNKIEITEVERVKYNTPPDIINCFQIHRLYYVKGDDNMEYLKGEWIPAPNQRCGGQGTTLLSRQVVKRVPFGVTLNERKNPPLRPIRKEPAKIAKKPDTREATASAKTQPRNEISPKPKVAPDKTETELPKTSLATEIPVESEKSSLAKRELELNKEEQPVYKGYENRKKDVVKTIVIENPVFQVNLYDNGVIDGDSVSLFYNGRLILSHKRLSDVPITVTLSVDKSRKDNVLTMYAENLGTIPPNTALMIVRDGDKRYEVRMESDMGKSGTVIFTH